MTSPPSAPSAQPMPSLLDARILLVDDDPATIQTTARLLAGYSELRFATSGGQALRLATEWLPELILLDAEMPGLSGFEVFKALQTDARLAAVPVIFVTQHRDAQVEASVFELGAADFVTKPVTGAALRARVAMHLRYARMARALAAWPRQDGLTGLASRPVLDERLAEEASRAQRSGRALSLLVAGIDHFHAYTEARGAEAGDDCLRVMARLVDTLAQRPGDLAARHGADAFALLLPETDHAGALALAERLTQALDAIDLPHPASLVAPRVTASVGCGVLSPGDATVNLTAAAQLLQATALRALQAARGKPERRVALHARGPTPPDPSPETLR